MTIIVQAWGGQFCPRNRFRAGPLLEASRLERRPHTGRCRKPGGLPINVRGSGNRETRTGESPAEIGDAQGSRRGDSARPGPAPCAERLVCVEVPVDAATGGLSRRRRSLALRSIVGGQSWIRHPSASRESRANQVSSALPASFVTGFAREFLFCRGVAMVLLRALSDFGVALFSTLRIQ